MERCGEENPSHRVCRACAAPCAEYERREVAWMRRRYGLALLAIGLLLVVSQAPIQHHLSDQVGHAQTINLAGRQRSFGHQIARYAVAWKAADSDADRADALERMRRSKANLDAEYPEVLRRLAEDHAFDPAALERLREAAEVSRRRLAADVDEASAAAGRGEPIDLAEVLAAADRFAADMDAMVSGLGAEMGGHVRTQKAIELGLHLLALVALVGASCFVFEPAARVLARSMSRLREEAVNSARAEQELRRTQGNLDQTGRLAKIGWWELDLRTNELSWSDEVRRIHEVAEDFRPDLASAIEFYAPDAREEIRGAVERAMEAGAPWDLELPLTTAAGRRIVVRAQGAARVEGGRRVALFGAFQDVTERHAIEDRLELAIDAAHAGVWDWNVPEGTFVTNPEFHRMLGDEPTEGPLPFSYFEERVHPDDLQRTIAAVRAAHDDAAASYRVDFRFRGADGTYRWIQSTGRVVGRDDAGAPLRMIGQHTDITTLKVALERAEEASRSKSAFLATMSHEIRTPMTAVLGYSDLLGTVTDAARRDEIVATIRRNGRHLLSIVDDILDLSKVEAGRLTCDRVATSPRLVVEDVLDSLRESAVAKGLSLREEIDDGVPRSVLTDPRRVRQVLLNLVGNGIKFTDAGGVTVRVAAEPKAENPDRVRLAFEVKDTGVGMTDEQIRRVFEPFEQGDASTTRRHGGVGLGLAIVRSLAEPLGAKVDVESRPGAGSTFRMILDADVVRLAAAGDSSRAGSGEAAPTAATAPNASADGPHASSPPRPAAIAETSDERDGAAAKPPPARPLDGVRVLLAEDGRDNQLILSAFLRRAGAKIDVAEDGQMAWDRLLECIESGEPHDLLLTDMMMPVLDGYGLASRVRDRGLSIPVLALTANAMPGDREKCLEAGCDDYLAKPVPQPALVEMCARWMATVRARESDVRV